jgi:hypothetical protein
MATPEPLIASALLDAVAFVSLSARRFLTIEGIATIVVGTIFHDIALFDLISLLFSDRESCGGAARWTPVTTLIASIAPRSQ